MWFDWKNEGYQQNTIFINNIVDKGLTFQPRYKKYVWKKDELGGKPRIN